jgi:hypothetical protein
VVSEPTEFGSTWIRPDGIVDQGVSAGPVQFPDPAYGKYWQLVRYNKTWDTSARYLHCGELGQ